MQQHRHWSLAIAFSIGMALIPIEARAVDTADTRLLSTPAITEGKIAFVYADDIWVADADGSNPRRLTSHPGRGAEPVLLAGRQAHRLHGQLRRQRRRLRDPDRGGRADPADLASRRGHRPRLHARRQGAVQLAARGLLATTLRSSTRSASTGGVPERLPIPSGRQGGHLARTANTWLTRRWASGSASGRTIAAARPRESGSSSSTTCRTRRSPSPPGAATTPSRCGSANGLLPLGSRRRVQPVLLRSRARRRSRSCTAPRRLPDRQRLGRRRQGHLRASRLDSPCSTRAIASRTGSRSAWPPTWPRPGPAMPSDAKHIRNAGISPTGKRAVLEYRGEIVTVPAKKGDSAQPHRDARRPRALARLVARRQVDRLFLRRDRRIPAASSGRRTARAKRRSYPLNGSGFYEQPRVVAR